MERGERSRQHSIRTLVGIGAAVVLLLVCRFEVRAETIYVCEDGKGNKHFTNLFESKQCKPFRQQTRLVYSEFKMWPSTASPGRRYRSLRGSAPYDSYITEYGRRYNVDPNLIKAVIRAESSFNSRAVSSKGARGLMQLMPETARQMHVADPFHPAQNIRGGTRYLRSLLDMFDDNLALSLAAYNAGPTLVKRLGRVPSINETVRYVKRVLAYYQAYGGNSEAVAEAESLSTIRVGDLKTIR